MFRIVATIYFGMALAAGLSRAEEPLKVAIIDSGANNLKDLRLCKNPGEVSDDIGHGTTVAKTITQYAKGNYCLLIYKAVTSWDEPTLNAARSLTAIYTAIADGAKIINMSYSGDGFDILEQEAIAHNKNVTFVVAAGNNGKDISILSNWVYPASYDLPNMIVVGATDKNGMRLKDSNYGKYVDAWREESCTSYATARRTGELIKERSTK